MHFIGVVPVFSVQHQPAGTAAPADGVSLSATGPQAELRGPFFYFILIFNFIFPPLPSQRFRNERSRGRWRWRVSGGRWSNRSHPRRVDPPHLHLHPDHRCGGGKPVVGTTPPHPPFSPSPFPGKKSASACLNIYAANALNKY